MIVKYRSDLQILIFPAPEGPIFNPSARLWISPKRTRSTLLMVSFAITGRAIPGAALALEERALSKDLANVLERRFRLRDDVRAHIVNRGALRIIFQGRK